MLRDRIHLKKDQTEGSDASGYTLIEVLITIVIMGVILVIVNVIMISIIRVSYTTDTRIKVRQNMDFSIEVFRRVARSAQSIALVESPAIVDEDPCWTEEAIGYYPEGVEMMIGGSDSVIFYVDKDENENERLNCKSVLKAVWSIDGSEYPVNLTSPSEVVIHDGGGCDVHGSGFTVNITVSDNGTSNVILTLQMDSAQEKSAGVPTVSCVMKEVSILKQPQEL